MTKLRIAVTGVAGASGQSCMHALQISGMDVDIIPVDVTPYSAGLYGMSCVGHVLPKPEEDIQAWVEFVKREKIDAIIPAADRDLMPLAKYAAETKALVSTPDFIHIATHKLRTNMRLKRSGLTAPYFYNMSYEDYLRGDIPDWLTFPVVLKPINDSAMRGVHICQDMEDLAYWLKRTHDPFLQEYLEGREYSVNCYCDRSGKVLAQLVLQRVMRDGVAYKSEPVDDESLREYGREVCLTLGATGVVNVQAREDKRGKAKVMEVNARLSGSAMIRALCGYNDTAFLVKNFLLGEKITQPKIDYSKFYFRTYNEIGVDRTLLPHATDKDVTWW